jgi:serine/threonine protein kinase
MVLQYIPCAPNDNKGEQIARNFLLSSLNHTYGTLLGNYHLPVNNGTRECDLVLFNRRGIWIIEVKNWRGRIIIDQVNWQRDDGLIQHSPLISVETKAKILASVLENRRFFNVSVVGLVVVIQPNAELLNTAEIKSREPRKDKIFSLDDRLIRALTGPHYLYQSGNRDLSKALIEEIVHMLLPRYIDLEQERIGDSYRIVQDLGPGPNNIFHAYKAEHINISGRYARAKKYYSPSVSSTNDLRAAIQRFRRDMQVLVKMERHPNIVQVYDYLPDRNSSDIYWLLLEWVKGITLQDRLINGPEIQFQEQRKILFAILNALDSCHSNDILHRNLSPACIHLANDGTVKLGDFDFARVPELAMTISITGQPLHKETNRYIAPELQTNAPAADARSDLYALGAIWYDMIVHPEGPDEDIDLSRLEGTDLPADALDLLVRLLSSDPDQRPRNAKAVKRWLEQVQG